MDIQRKVMPTASLLYSQIGRGSVFSPVLGANSKTLFIKTNGNGVSGRRAVRLEDGEEHSYSYDDPVILIPGKFVEE